MKPLLVHLALFVVGQTSEWFIYNQWSSNLHTRRQTVRPSVRSLFTTHEWSFDTRMPWQLGWSSSSFLLRYTKVN